MTLDVVVEVYGRGSDSGFVFDVVVVTEFDYFVLEVWVGCHEFVEFFVDAHFGCVFTFGVGGDFYELLCVLDVYQEYESLVVFIAGEVLYLGYGRVFHDLSIIVRDF